MLLPTQFTSNVLATACRRLAVRLPACWIVGLVAVVLGAGLLTSCRAKQRGQPSAARIDTRIRVRLLGAGNPLKVASSSSYRLVSQHGGESRNLLGQPTGVIISNKNGQLAVNRRILPEAHCLKVIPADRAALLYVNDRQYRGQLWVYKAGQNSLTAVNILDVEDYLGGVLAGELLGRFDAETFKVQAIAARTYALYQKLTRGKSRIYDVVDSVGSQVYHGSGAESTKALEAVKATAGLVLAYDAGAGLKIFNSYYSSTCGGWTQDASLVKNVLRIKPLAGAVRCDYCKSSPYYRWKPVSLTAQTITTNINRRYPKMKLGLVRSIKPIKVTAGGRIAMLELTDSAGRRQRLRGEDFRLSVGARILPSTHCKLRQEADRFVFYQGQGLGHGMGMCQYGAEGMANSGFGALAILQHYYPAARIVRAY